MSVKLRSRGRPGSFRLIRFETPNGLCTDGVPARFCRCNERCWTRLSHLALQSTDEKTRSVFTRVVTPAFPEKLRAGDDGLDQAVKSVAFGRQSVHASILIVGSSDRIQPSPESIYEQLAAYVVDELILPSPWAMYSPAAL